MNYPNQCPHCEEEFINLEQVNVMCIYLLNVTVFRKSHILHNRKKGVQTLTLHNTPLPCIDI